MNYKYDLIEIIDFIDFFGIVVDVFSLNRIECVELLLDKKFIVVLRIDYYFNDSDIEYKYLWVDECYVVVVEMIVKIVYEVNWIVIKKVVEYVFLGIVIDSGRFLYLDILVRIY